MTKKKNTGTCPFIFSHPFWSSPQESHHPRENPLWLESACRSLLDHAGNHRVHFHNFNGPALPFRYQH
jgi:hypothetical protein